MQDLRWLEERLGYSFEEPELLRRALIHPSAKGIGGVTQEDAAHLKRLSWLGDAVLGMVVSDKLYSLFPSASRDQLHRWRARLTNNKILGLAARRLELEKAMVIAVSTRQNPTAANSLEMFATALESVIGAVFVDGGVSKARTVIRRILAEEFMKLLEHNEEWTAAPRS
jgi:ribonuclease-3